MPYARYKDVVPVQVLLSPKQIESLDRLAKANTESRSTIVRQAVNALLKQEEREAVA